MFSNKTYHFILGWQRSLGTDHAFLNDTRPEVYDKEAAKDAWERVLNFFGSNL
ncbi:MAG: dienelactone hydrolase family protein [Pyrinomonadaceae bacterium]|nr:dienelactone hydrolase family protein [Pyrinomonadaceae bacterium]